MKKIFLLVLPVLALCSGCGLTKVAQRTQAPDVVSNINVSPNLTINTSTAASHVVSTSTLGHIQWHKPVEIADPKLFNEQACQDYSLDCSSLYYYEVGTLNEGPYLGGKIILLSAGCSECEPFQELYRFLHFGSRYILLNNYSYNNSYSYFSDTSTAQLDEVSSTVGVVTSTGDSVTSSSQELFETADYFDIPDLDIPPEIIDPKSGTKLIFYGNPNSASFSADFASPTDTPIFIANSGQRVFGYPMSEIFDVASPDGTSLPYSLDSSSTLDVANLTWKDGKTRDNGYAYEVSDGCGQIGPFTAYMAHPSSKPLNAGDLIQAGTDSNGIPFYVLANPNHPILKTAKIIYDNEPPHKDRRDLVIFWKDPFGRLIPMDSFLIIDACGGKPVIYLYPTKPTNVSVQVAPAGGISKSEPKYDDGWNVLANPDGHILAGNKVYPYLFWEGGLGSYQMPAQGFVVSKAEVKNLITEKLSLIGLLPKEISDFEQFWVPRMQSAPYYFISFNANDVMDKYAPLTIEPKPDTIIRVLMDFKPLEQPVTVEQQQLQSIKRHGFTVVEWGGILK